MIFIDNPSSTSYFLLIINVDTIVRLLGFLHHLKHDAGLFVRLMRILSISLQISKFYINHLIHLQLTIRI